MNFKSIIIHCLILLALASNTLGQKTYNDFLTEDDINKKAEIGIFLWNEYLRSDLDSLKIMSVELLLDAAEKKSKFARAVGYGSLGSYLIRVEDVESGIHHLKHARKYYEVNEDLTRLSETYNEIGHGYLLLGENQNAIKAYLNSIRTGENAPDETAAFNGKLGMGKAYLASGDTALAVITISQYKNESLKLSKFEAIADAYAILGQIEMDRKNIGLSREHYRKSILFSEKSASKIYLSHALNNKAILHFNLNEFDSSLFYFDRSLQIRMGLNNLRGVAESYFNIASYYQGIDNLDEALVYFTKSADLARKNKFRADEMDVLIELIGIYNTQEKEEEINLVQKRIDALKKIISGKKSIDKEIIEYAETAIGNAEMEKKLDEKEEKPYAVISIIVISVAILLSLTFLRLRQKH